MIARLFAIAVLAMGLLVCAPDANAHGGGSFGVRGRVFFPRSQVVFRAPSYNYVPRNNVVFFQQPQVYQVPVFQAPVNYGGYGFQSQIQFNTGGSCYSGF